MNRDGCLEGVDGLRRRLAGAAAAGLGLAALGGCGSVAGGAASTVTQDYAAALRSALQPFTGQLAGYHYRATPLGNFGVGSVYLGDVQGGDPAAAEGGWFLGGPQNWLAPGLPERERAGWFARVVSEGSFGAFRLDADRQRALHASLGAAVFIALGASASLDYRRGAELSFQAGEVRNRRLNWAELQAALAAGQVAPAVAQALSRSEFVIAAADLVLADYRAEVAVDEAVNPALAASLRAKTLQPRIKDLRSGSGALSLREATRGRFVASSSQPLVAAVLFKRPPPRAKGAPLPSDLSRWPSADPAAVDAVESRVLGASG